MSGSGIVRTALFILQVPHREKKSTVPTRSGRLRHIGAVDQRASQQR